MKKIYYFLFVFIPVICLFFMGVFLDTHKTESVQERRTLASKPKKIFSESQQLENYISDHLLFRDEILSLYFRLGFGFNF